MGDDFEEKYEQKTRERREKARKVEKETLMEIAFQAIEGGGFDGEEPRFRFDAGEIDHDVLLMESPDDNIQKFKHQLGEDAMSLGMFHLDQLFSCAFQEHMLGLLDKIEEDEYYMVVGRYQEKTQADGSGEERTYYNVNPVRGIVPIQVAKQYAEKYKDQMQGKSIEEQAQEQSSESSSSDSSDSEPDLGGLSDDDSQVDKDRIIQVFQAIGNKAPEVLEQVAQGDSDAMDKLVQVTNNNLDSEADRERILDVFEEQVEEIPGRGEDEEDEDDGLDLGGLGGDDNDSEDESETSEDTSEDEEEEPETDDADEEDGDDDSEGVEDWF